MESSCSTASTQRYATDFSQFPIELTPPPPPPLDISNAGHTGAGFSATSCLPDHTAISSASACVRAATAALSIAEAAATTEAEAPLPAMKESSICQHQQQGSDLQPMYVCVMPMPPLQGVRNTDLQ